MTQRDDAKHETRLLEAHIWLRTFLGCCGLGLPVALLIGSWLFTDEFAEGSISAYYYTPMRDILVGTLCAIGAFLLAYVGRGGWDNWTASLAGVGAIFVALIPSNSAIAFAHFISALIMLGGFGYISFFLFTKLDLGQTREDDGKIIRNRWYRGFGAAIWVFLALLAIVFGLRELADWWPSWLSNIKPVFVLETLAVWAFGASWFLKGVAHARWLSRLRELSPIKSLRPAS